MKPTLRIYKITLPSKRAETKFKKKNLVLHYIYYNGWDLLFSLNIIPRNLMFWYYNNTSTKRPATIVLQYNIYVDGWAAN